MYIEQIYTGCLAQGAYYIESNGEAAIIDPLRETDAYVRKAADRGATIKYILETHFHADFVSGHVDLARKTDAKIVYGPTATADFAFHSATHDEVLPLGNVTLRVLHTPGHTLESTCYLLEDPSGKPHAVFTGDTLFIGDVGRPDLAQKAAHLTQEDLAATLFRSLRAHLMTLPPDVLVYPAHGAGSACGKNLSSKTWDTIGGQLATNYALRADMTEAEFVAEVTDGLLPPPQYFPANVAMNRAEIPSVDTLLDHGTRPLSPEAFVAAVEGEDALVLDTRSADAFAAGHVPGSIFIGIDGGFAPWVGALIPDLKQPLAIVADENRVEEVITRLARVGYDRTIGYLAGGLAAWSASGREAASLERISAADFAALAHREPVTVLDVRKPGEFEAEHLEMARSLPLDFLNDHLAEVPTEGTVYTHCAGGYRSMIFNSILKARGYHHLVDVVGGFKALQETDVPRTTYVCPSTKTT
jgi:glyoxylase-like metal-dependent hydrolase (beta-lactamase superfamily II)/rhodanese-related sulfurtransferase